MLKGLNDAYRTLLLGEKKDMSHKFIPNPDSGTLFPNGFKKNDSHPDFTGTYATATGEVREFAAWFNDKDGRQYISVKFSDQYVASKRA